MNRKLLALYGLKFNPFAPELPTEALWIAPEVENFLWRIEFALVREGGFALITGESGSGKSVTLRLLSERLAAEPDLVVGAISRPQANVADFYRELGDVFGVPLRPHNRWGGAKALRERWTLHLDTTLLRPLLLVDEAQELAPPVAAELRLLSSTRFDSRQLLSVVLAGDLRLQDKLRHQDLVPLGNRVRTRLALQPASVEQLQDALKHLLNAAGNSALMTDELIVTLCEHALGNYRVLLTTAAELLVAAAPERVVPDRREALLRAVLTGTALPRHPPPALTMAALRVVRAAQLQDLPADTAALAYRAVMGRFGCRSHRGSPQKRQDIFGVGVGSRGRLRSSVLGPFPGPLSRAGARPRG